MPWTDSVETADGSDEGTHGGAAAAEPGPAEPEAAAEEETWCGGQGPTRTGGEEEEGGGLFDEVIGTATTKRVMSGMEVLDSVSKSMSEMSLLSMLVAAAAQGLPIWKR
jgi:hypothetical protein